MKLSTLRKSAQQSTAFRGHAMRWGDPFGNATTNVWSQFGRCRRCGAKVLLRERTAPNQIEIGGDALAIACKPETTKC